MNRKLLFFLILRYEMNDLYSPDDLLLAKGAGARCQQERLSCGEGDEALPRVEEGL